MARVRQLPPARGIRPAIMAALLLPILLSGCTRLVRPAAPSGSTPRGGTWQAPAPVAGSRQPEEGSRQPDRAGAADPLGAYLLIADRYNRRLLIVDAQKRVLWSYVFPAELVGPDGARGPDDAFFTPGYRTIITNEEDNHTIFEVDIRTKRIVWRYGHPGIAGSKPGYLNGPDDAYRLSAEQAHRAGLPEGTTTVADIRNCRVLFISPTGEIVRQYGRTGVCRHHPPRTLDRPNGDQPLPDGGMLVTEIGGSHVVRLGSAGQVVWDLQLREFPYPSDAQLLPDGNVLVASYRDPGQIEIVSPDGRVLWRYRATSGPGRLNKPSLALMLPSGNVAVNDDANHRVVVIDPETHAIVWQFGVTGVAGSDAAHLDVPDGMDVLPYAVAPSVLPGLPRR